MTTVLSALIVTQMFGDAELAASLCCSGRTSSLHAVINPPAPIVNVTPAVLCRKRRLVSPRELSTGELVDLVIRITRSSLLNSLNNHRIGAATAQVGAHRIDDFLPVWVGIPGQQARRAHYLS